MRTYGQRASSRVEANHSTLDTFLTDATGDLLDLGLRLKEKIDHVQREYNAKLAQERLYRRAKFHNNDLFTKLCTRIAVYALEKLHEQYQLAKKACIQEEGRGECKGNFSANWGLPCRHMMYDFLKVNDEGRLVATGHFDVENIDRHWLLEKDLVSFFFLAPVHTYSDDNNFIFI